MLREESSKINNLNVYLKKLEEEKQIKPQQERKKTAEINEIEHEQTIEKIGTTNFFPLNDQLK